MNRRASGSGKANGGGDQSSDIYKQLIDNDMVKELDDIEAISQQISQHAEVLYNSWKSKGMTQGPPHNFKLSPSGGGGSGGEQGANPLARDLRERGGSSVQENGGVEEVQGGASSPYPANNNSLLLSRKQQTPLPQFHSVKTSVYRNGSATDGPADSYGSLGRHSNNSAAGNYNGYNTHSLDRLNLHGNGGNVAGHDPRQGYNSLDSQRYRLRSQESPSSSPRPSEPGLSASSMRGESPAKGSSITHIGGHLSPTQQLTTDVGPLELLASPNLSGNLEELVTSFVSTDRAKQAARNTISSTIMRRLSNSSANGSNTTSPMRSPSPSSPSMLGYRGSSPLRSPMLTNSVCPPGESSMQNSLSNTQNTSSPRASLASMFPNEMAVPISSSFGGVIPFNNMDVHAPMQSIFSTSDSGRLPSTSRSSTPTSSLSRMNTSSPSPSIKTSQPSVIKSPVTPDQADSIPIPVKIVKSPSANEGLKSPSVLQTVNKNPFQFPSVKGHSNSGSMSPTTSTVTSPPASTAAAVSSSPTSTPPSQPGGVKDVNAPMTNLFDEYGRVSDAEANIQAMRRRFEEARQRMALSLPAREGGIRPNSLIGRSLFDNPPWGDDPSTFLLEQMRRRNKRRMMEIPAAPHPELTPQQKQHIFERSTGQQGGLPSGVPIRRMLPGGSVAERVLMFENSPAMLGMEPAPVRIPARREPTVAGTALTSWKSQLHESQKQENRLERIVPIERLEAAPLLRHQDAVVKQQQLGASPAQQPSAPQPQLGSKISPKLGPIAAQQHSATSPQLSPSVPQQNNAGPLQQQKSSAPAASPAASVGDQAATGLQNDKPQSSLPLSRSQQQADADLSAGKAQELASQILNNNNTIQPVDAKQQQQQLAGGIQPVQPSFRSTGFQLSAPPQFLARPRHRQPQSNFRPPSLHLPGKEEIPKFYFPNGNPSGKANVEQVTKKLLENCGKHHFLTLEQLGDVLKASGLPLFWKSLVWSVSGGSTVEKVNVTEVTRAWRKLTSSSHDEASQFVSLCTNGARSYLVPEDLVPLIQDVVDTHPGLLFLKEATEFHSRYVHTVIARIFYVVNRSWSGKITLSELRRSSFLATLKLLQDEDDINQITDYFSYEHFYVIYCKFWELDKDHDLFIDRDDLARHNDHALSTRIIERIFSGAVTRGVAQKEGRMSYTEFVWFLLSEEDKRNPTAIEYWFRCMDLDGDGVLSMYELQYFYEEQLQRMEQLGIETLSFNDCLCQMLDMIRSDTPNKITLRDLKRCKMTPIFFDTFFNLEKYLDHEQRDPFATQRETDEDGNEMSDWDRFAAEEYELLVAEEGNNDNMDDMNYDDGSGGEMGSDSGGDGERHPLGQH